MVRVTDDTKAIYKSFSVPKTLEIRIPDADITLINEDLVTESFSLTESIENQPNFSFTGCIASIAKFKCFDFATEVRGKAIEIDIMAEDAEDIPLFRGIIEDVTNLTHEDAVREITAYDMMYTINNADVTSWYNSLTFPISIMNMRNSFFNYFGVTQVPTYLANDNMTVYKTIADEHIKGETIIKNICKINGVFGQINRNGDFIYRQLTIGTEALYPREDLFPANDLYPSDENANDNISKAHYKKIQYEDYSVAPITKVQLISREDAIVATAGSGTNIFTVNDNPLIYDKSASELAGVARNLLNVVQYLWYVPMTLQAVGLPYIECGDFVMCSTRRNIVRAYVLKRTLTGIQALSDTYEADGDETQPTYTSSFKATATAISSELDSAITSEYERAMASETQMRQDFNSTIEDTANGLRSSISQTASQIRLEVQDTRNNLQSSITQTASSIRSEVSNTASGLSSRIEQTASSITLQASRIDVLANTVSVQGNLIAQKVTASQVSSQISQTLTSFAGTLHCNSITVGGTTYNRARHINSFGTDGHFITQITVLSN